MPKCIPDPLSLLRIRVVKLTGEIPPDEWKSHVSGSVVGLVYVGC